MDEKIYLKRILKPIVTKLIYGGPEAQPLDGEELAVILETLHQVTQLCTDTTFSLPVMPIVFFWKAIHIYGTSVPRDFLTNATYCRHSKKIGSSIISCGWHISLEYVGQ